MLGQAWLIPAFPIAAFLLIMVCGRFEPLRSRFVSSGGWLALLGWHCWALARRALSRCW